MSALETIVIGAGARGNAYGQFAIDHPDKLRVVGVAEPDALRRDRFVASHQIAPENVYENWQDLLRASTRLAPAAMNCTMDRQHYSSTMQLLEQGYDVLLEKPMSPVMSENIRLVQKAEQTGRLLQICHVLRYTLFWQALRSVVQSGVLGRIVSVTHRENLAFWHMAHSFVRGNWRSEQESGAMILAKCCHDFDILLWILRQEVVWLNSFGSLTHFRAENAPEGAPPRCTDGCPAAENCKYEATRIYGHDGNRFPLDHVSFVPTREARLEAIRTGPYGRCVYHADNDVVDHQTVNMELTDGTTVVLTMNGQGDEECRTMRWDGTKATLYGKFSSRGHELRIHHHLTGSVEQIPIESSDSSGHGGGDFGIVRSFVNILQGIQDDRVSTARESLESHLLAFAAEQSRLTRSTIHMPTFRQQAEAQASQA